jgi:hypothetical protein
MEYQVQLFVISVLLVLIGYVLILINSNIKRSNDLIQQTITQRFAIAELLAKLTRGS